MALSRFIARRLIFLVLLLLGATMITFTVANLVPGDPVLVNLGQAAMSDPQIVAAYRARYNLDKPLPYQYVAYLRNLAQGDLGRSVRNNQPVASELARYVPATFELATFATLFSIIFGVISGVISAVWRARWPDHVVRLVSVIGVSVPNFWLALVILYVFYFRLGWAPGPGRVDSNMVVPGGTGLILLDAILAGNWVLLKNALAHLILPTIVLASFTTGVITRTTRSSLLEVLAQDYIRTARAKGLTERIVLFRHALTNAFIPTLTIIGLSYGNLLGGTVLVETIFALPGIGRYAYQATTTLDFPAIMGVTLVITVVYVVINLIVDVCYGLLDPRVRFQ